MKRLLEEHVADAEGVVLSELETKYDLGKLRDLGDEYSRWGREPR